MATSSTWTTTLLERRTVLDNPDAGRRTTVYNAFGEVASEAGRVASTVYELDGLGRVGSSSDAVGKTVFTWDVARNGIGQIAGAMRPNAPLGQDVVSTTHEYDQMGRESSVTMSAYGLSGVSLLRSYDDYHRLAKVTYPAVGDRPALAAIYNWDGNGILASIDANGAPLWTAVEYHPSGRLTKESAAGIATTRLYWERTGAVREIVSRRGTRPVQHLMFRHDRNGNVTWRRDVLNWLSEDFQYDHVDRLELSKRTTDGGYVTKHRQHVYDEIGNILEQIDLSGSWISTRYFYDREPLPGGGFTGPHAVTRTTFDQYRYDASGRQIQGPDRTVTYTSFDLPQANYRQRTRSGILLRCARLACGSTLQHSRRDRFDLLPRRPL